MWVVDDCCFWNEIVWYESGFYFCGFEVMVWYVEYVVDVFCDLVVVVFVMMVVIFCEVFVFVGGEVCLNEVVVVVVDCVYLVGLVVCDV